MASPLSWKASNPTFRSGPCTCAETDRACSGAPQVTLAGDVRCFPDPAVLLPFTIAVVVIALTPGPVMTFFLGRALAEGRTAGLVALAGAWTGSIRCWWASVSRR
jgi:hypothetical protein